MADSTQGSRRLEGMQTLLEEIIEIEKDKDRSEDSMARVKVIVEESTKMVEESEKPHEMVVDAKILQISTQLVHSNITSFETNFTTFDPYEYANGIMEHMENISRIPGVTDWDDFSEITCCMFKKTFPLTYMLGTFVMEPPAPKDSQKPQRQRKTADAQKKVLESCENEAEDVDEGSEVYEHILKCLVQQYRKNNRSPVGYYEFVINPNDYWATVENVFHLSFLVRDGKVKVTLDEKHLPVIQPIIKKPVDGGPKHNNQFICRLTQQDWKEFKKIYNITQAAILPLNK